MNRVTCKRWSLQCRNKAKKNPLDNLPVCYLSPAGGGELGVGIGLGSSLDEKKQKDLDGGL